MFLRRSLAHNFFFYKLIFFLLPPHTKKLATLSTAHPYRSDYLYKKKIRIMFRSYIAHITSKWRLYALEALLPQLFPPLLVSLFRRKIRILFR